MTYRNIIKRQRRQQVNDETTWYIVNSDLTFPKDFFTINIIIGGVHLEQYIKQKQKVCQLVKDRKPCGIVQIVIYFLER